MVNLNRDDGYLPAGQFDLTTELPRLCTAAQDGAVVLSDRWDVLAFGAKIGRSQSGPFVEDVLVREPIRGHTPVKMPASELGGTRHLSAAQFIHEQRDALALVASQDGRFTVFGWSPRAQLVHAYRVEALLL